MRTLLVPVRDGRPCRVHALKSAWACLRAFSMRLLHSQVLAVAVPARVGASTLKKKSPRVDTAAAFVATKHRGDAHVGPEGPVEPALAPDSIFCAPDPAVLPQVQTSPRRDAAVDRPRNPGADFLCVKRLRLCNQPKHVRRTRSPSPRRPIHIVACRPNLPSNQQPCWSAALQRQTPHGLRPSTTVGETILW